MRSFTGHAGFLLLASSALSKEIVGTLGLQAQVVLLVREVSLQRSGMVRDAFSEIRGDSPCILARVWAHVSHSSLGKGSQGNPIRPSLGLIGKTWLPYPRL